MAGPVRIAVLGSGFIAAYHARAVAELPGAESSRPPTGGPSRSPTLAGAFAIPRTTTDWRELVGDRGSTRSW